MEGDGIITISTSSLCCNSLIGSRFSFRRKVAADTGKLTITLAVESFMASSSIILRTANEIDSMSRIVP